MEISARAGPIRKGEEEKRDEKLTWWQLSLICVGCIIGTGFFIGTGVGISMTGPSILISLFLAGIGTYTVIDRLGKMAALYPEKGAFRYYAKKAYGNWAGFTSGWIYWFSEMFICGSQLTALSILSTFWFPNIPLWFFATCYAILGIFVIMIGTRGFERCQHLFAIIKVGAICMFIVLAISVLLGFFGGKRGDFTVPQTANEMLPGGWKGLWASLIYGFYIYGGVEMLGILAPRLKKKEEARKSGVFLLFLLMAIYLIALALAILLVGNKQFRSNESPFITALEQYPFPSFPYLFTGGIIIAGFSTMAGSLFAVTSMIVTLAEDGDAPRILARKGNLKIPPLALSLTIVGLISSIIVAFIVPDHAYEYITTAAGLLLLYNWIFILFSSPKIVKETTVDFVKRWIGIILIFFAIVGTMVHSSSRIGFFVSILFVFCVIFIQFVLHKGKRKYVVGGEEG